VGVDGKGFVVECLDAGVVAFEKVGYFGSHRVVGAGAST
jgi:hypothetical protein